MTARPVVRVADPPPGRRVPSARTGVWLLAAGACLAWTPFLAHTLSPDEAGFLMVAGQWQPGDSLYGDYWVDRPPGLVALFALADLAGGDWAVRALGLLAVATSVLLAGLLGRIVAPHSERAALLPAASAALLLATPLTGSGGVNGELLGLPFLLAGFAAILLARSAPTPGRAVAWAGAAGVAGAAAALIKQSLVDVFVLAAVVLVADLVTGHRSRARVAAVAASGVAGALALTGAVVLLAYGRGTGPGALWDAVVGFRGEATRVILESATDATRDRLARVLLALVGTGMPLLAVALARLGRHSGRGAGLRRAAYALLAWELLVVVSGGSYWLHYLVGLVPGIVLLAAAAGRGLDAPGRTLPVLRTAFALAVASLLVAVASATLAPFERPEDRASAWISDHARPGETGVVAFGAPNILHAAGLTSPYPDLWSLPVRVRDPQLDRLGAVLTGPDRPDWLIVYGRSLDTWGIDGRHADALVEEYYTPVATTGTFVIHRRRDRP
ncbi:hypothetical protein [Nocardioides pantholopis]|uniref:hypothetical protein n=1 Tax=Nocardioides pantholopis TaxID=2483798 RepID=UPI000FD8B850|nr:hypothetical protein [Nocardioides pantholopis]